MRNFHKILAVAFFLPAFSGAGAMAKPLITSSEDTHARICLARDEPTHRLIEACTAALSEPSLTQGQRVDLLVAQGGALLWDDQDAKAEAAYHAAIALDSTSTPALNGLGWTLRDSDGDAAAFDVFEQSLAIEPSARGLAGKASTGRYSGVLSTQEARDLLMAALAIDPEYAWAIREIAWSYFDDDKYSAAQASFNDALALDPDDTNAHFGLGRSSLRAGDPEAALEHFNTLLGIAPDDYYARVYRIVSLRRLDRNAQALRDADRFIEDHPTKSAGYVQKGRALMALERRAEAIAVFRDSESKTGPDNNLLYWYADALTYDGQMQEALGIIDRALELDGADASDHLLKSYIALELKDYSMARDAAEASLDTGTDDPWAHYYVAICEVHSGDVSVGLSRFDQAMETGLPDDRVGAFARELIGAGKYVEAAQLRLKY